MSLAAVPRSYGSVEPDKATTPDLGNISSAAGSVRREAKTHRTFGAVAGFLGIFGCIWIAGSRTLQQERHEVVFASTNRFLLTATAKNSDYAKDIGGGYPFLEAHLVAEPQRLTTISVESLDEVLVGSCNWSLTFVHGGGPWDDIPGVIPAHEWGPSGFISPNDTIAVIFPSPSTYTLAASCSMADVSFSTGESLKSAHRELTQTVKCYYVRRELRQLTISDREDFLNIFLLMSKLETEAGISQYGKHYRSLRDFETMHLKAATDKKLDKIHDGMGVVTQHISITSEFEIGLQSVKPHISVPYWDYTIDSAKVMKLYGGADYSKIFETSELFTEEWFGSTDGKTHTVTKGRFANFEVPRGSNATTMSPFGYLRSPWNINNAKYVTRFHKLCGDSVYVGPEITVVPKIDRLGWPTCESHFKVTQGSNLTNWYDWVWFVSYSPHGPVHSWMGGIGGECDHWDMLSETVNITSKQVRELKHAAFNILKNSYRFSVFDMPTYCTADTEMKDCMWTCKEGVGDPNSELAGYLGVYTSINTSDHSVVKKVAHELCNTPYYPGDHLEAGSPIEASFWPIHPTLDRLLQYKDLVRPFNDTTWADYNCTGLNTSHSSGCAKSNCESSPWSNCEGHHAYDLTFWQTVSFDSTEKIYKKSYRTNQEVRNAVLAGTSDYLLPYIYDNFEWSHCEDIGVHFAKVSSQNEE